MDIKEIISKPIFKKWWFWVIIAFFVLGLIGAAGEDISENTVEDDNTTRSLEEETFNEDFDILCETITDTYKSIGTVSCQDENTWKNNHEGNPEVFPYEYRDINITLGDEIAYEIKVVANTENMDYFKENYTCSEIYLGDGSCIVEEANDNILYATILYNEDNQEEILKLSEELKTLLNEQ